CVGDSSNGVAWSIPTAEYRLRLPDVQIPRRSSRGAAALRVGKPLGPLWGTRPGLAAGGGEGATGLDHRGGVENAIQVGFRQRRALARQVTNRSSRCEGFFGQRLGYNRVDLTWHDRAAWLHCGHVELADAGAGTAAHPPNIVGDFEQRNGDRSHRATRCDDVVDCALGLEVVGRFLQVEAGSLIDEFDGSAWKISVHVDAGANGVATESHLAQL